MGNSIERPAQLAHAGAGATEKPRMIKGFY
jgi:hypothetical protein